MLTKVTPQRRDADCGVACLAMLINKPYEEVLIAVAAVQPKFLKRGLWLKEIATAALNLGVRLQKRKYDPELTGIVRVSSRSVGHVVFQLDGKFIDTDATIWEPELYLKTNRVKTGFMLVIEGEH
jgi:ABC-type bacteriocin/lantibiotic exporter with double-glycine peptidase domain